MQRNHYETLGVDQAASMEEIKKQYKKLALRFHPDKKKGEDSQFAAIVAAYEVLSDPAKREAYDLELKCVDLNKNNLRRICNLPLDNFYEELQKILADYTQKLKIKDKEIDVFKAEHQFLCIIQYYLSDKYRESLQSSNFSPLKKSNLNLSNSLDALVIKFNDKLLLKTRSEMLILQDYIQAYLKDFIAKGDDKIKRIFGDKLPKMYAYQKPFEIEFDTSEMNYLRKTNVASRRQFIIDTIKKSPIGACLEVVKSDSNKNLEVESLKFRVKIEHFKTRRLAEGHSQPEASTSSSSSEDEILRYKKGLLAYIEERSGKEKYTGSRWGFNRKEKVEAAQSLVDLLSGRINHSTFFSSKRYLKALNQGELKTKAREAMKYVEKKSNSRFN